MSDTNEPKNSGFQRNHESEINIESIISAPLIAASKANTMMLSGQTRFLLDYCFVKRNKTSGSDGKDIDAKQIYDPVMINLTMTRSVVRLIDDVDRPGQQTEVIENKEILIPVPLLSLLSLNSIAIEKIKVDFHLDITSITSYNTNDGVIERKAQLNGKISSDDKSRNNGDGSAKFSNNSQKKLAVQIEAGPLPLPLGVLSILDLYSKNIHPSQVK